MVQNRAILCENMHIYYWSLVAKLCIATTVGFEPTTLGLLAIDLYNTGSRIQ